ncbi:MAG: transglycosylase domain-containing protein [Nannocystis sp.]|nr:biosynthetic peptidoglycan transglycosylase [Nannocystis sp.]MBA3550094.1 transglycosylase domain-containing protein [Nannocystis sp.]
MSTPASPARTRSRWRLALILFGGTVLLAGGIVASYPVWADSFVQAKVTERLHRLTGATVEMEAFELEYSSVTMRGVVLTIDPQTSIRLDRVDVEINRELLWSGKVIITSVEATGGAVRGDIEVFRARFAEARAKTKSSESSGGGRIRAIPDRAAVQGITLDLTRPVGEHTAHLLARADVDVRLVQGKATLTLSQVEASLGERALRAASVSTTMTRVPGQLAFALEFPISVQIEGGATALTPQIAMADVSGSVRIADVAFSEVGVDLAGGFSDEPRAPARAAADPTVSEDSPPLWTLKGSAARDLSSGTIDLTMAAFKLGRIPAVLAQLPVVRSEDATVGGDLQVAFSGGKALVEGDLALAGLNIDHPLLARQPVLGLGFNFDFSAEIDPAQRRVTISAATLRRGGLEVDVDGEFVHPEDPALRKYRLHLAVPKVACQEVIKAIPAELAPSLVGFELKGDFELDLQANIDFSDLEKLALTGRIEKDKCKAVKTPALVAASRLNGAFTHRVTMRDGSQRTVDLSEGSGSFTALDQISPYMVAAVMTTEDGGFWRHKGFLTSQFQAALKSNLEAGKIRLGASTITMQMVKNVLLAHERTLSRKLQELILTWYVEQSLSKQRIMEIYLNVIEFGPGIYGVTRGASHYFGKTPAELTPPEAVYLALMLPSPVRRHVNYCEGALTPAFQVKMKRLLAIMQNRGRLDPETYEVWKDGVIVFDPTDLPSRKECLAEIQRLLAASSQQRSLSGLLDDSGPDDESLPLTADEVVDAGRAGKKKGKAADGFDAAALEALGGDDPFLQAGEVP